MINVNQLIYAGVRTANANAPALLTAFGAVGVVTTSVLTAKATYKAANVIRDEQEKRRLHESATMSDEYLRVPKFDRVKLVWPLYIGAVFSGALSCGAIVMAHRVSSRRAAALAAAYALSEGRLEEYKEKIQEKFGIKKEKETRDEIAQDKVTRDFENGTIIFDPHEGKVLIKDEYSGRYFYSTIEEVNKAVNEINREIFHSMGSSATMAEFYSAIGLEPVATSSYMGWNTNEQCEIDWSTCTSPDGKHAVHSFDFVNPPIMNPDSNASFR